LSRKDHRDYDAALQKLRNMEAAVKKPEGFQPKDIIAICLVAFMALALFPLAPKLGRGLTAVVLILMIVTLWYGIQLGISWGNLPERLNGIDVSSSPWRWLL